ncbi:hypothetical protein BU23DRAFT_69012 [Bimuria novae-zelandiae CBS 107.79]|uniref:Uncharacterized protein n=1 Tax=Bimuria novae-zelandiae CBS 107.79 TaxID=1447943 RepID=A0A6A5VFK8_9PLEO|nr:hypothetical protein BU23DRAFT_69012 [Bimuria novae-zelandiae CBS 107.79]
MVLLYSLLQYFKARSRREGTAPGSRSVGINPCTGPCTRISKGKRVASAGLCDLNVVLRQDIREIPVSMFAFLCSPAAIGACAGATCMHRLPLCQARGYPFGRVELLCLMLCFFSWSPISVAFLPLDSRGQRD